MTLIPKLGLLARILASSSLLQPAKPTTNPITLATLAASLTEKSK